MDVRHLRINFMQNVTLHFNEFQEGPEKLLAISASSSRLVESEVPF
jgi:hypothetical protein